MRDTGEVFGALTERQGQLRELITQLEPRLRDDREPRPRARRHVPGASRPSCARAARPPARLTAFADNTNPLVTSCGPAARQLSPTLIDLDGLAPDLQRLFSDLDPLIRVSQTGLPATEEVLDDTRPLLARLDPFLRDLKPIVDYLGLYKREIAAFFANDAAATQATEAGSTTRAAAPLPAHDEPAQPGDPGRLPAPARHQPLEPVHRAGRLRQARTEGHLEVFGSYLCTANPDAAAAGAERVPRPQSSPTLIEQFVFGGDRERAARRRRARSRRRWAALVGQPGRYPAALAAAAVATRPRLS